MRILTLTLLFFLLVSCRKEIARYEIDGPSGQRYKVLLYENNSYQFRPLDESLAWMDGKWIGGSKVNDTLTLVIELSSMKVMREFIVEKDSLRTIDSRFKLVE